MSSEGGWLAEVTWAGGYLFVGADRRGHSVVYDSEDQAPKGISPMASLLTALAACSGMDVVAILGKRNQRLRSLKVMLKGSRREHGYPKPWESIEVRYVLAGELEERFVEEAINDSMNKFCSVAATLRPETKVTHSYEIVR